MPITNSHNRGFLTPRLYFVAVLGVLHIMAFLGTYFVGQYREQQLQGAATAGGLYVEGFLAPHAHEFFATQNLSADSKTKLAQLLDRQSVSEHFKVLKIWDATGKFIISTDSTIKDEDEDTEDIARALQGETIVEMYTDVEEHPNSSIKPPYLEIHAPILDLTNSKIIAIGELYQDATGFLRERAIAESSIWTTLAGFSALGLVGLMLLISWQRKTLMQHLDEVSAIAQQNQLLKEEAVRTLIDASSSNEELLNQIGAELHDGPIQMLSLMLLMGGTANAAATTADGMTSNDIGNRVISELRAISTGLSLPEIADLTLPDALLMAVSRHEIFTGQKVETDFDKLPDIMDQALKICCFRFVQERLTNSFKHAGGARQRVSGDAENNTLTLIVQDSGGVAAMAKPAPAALGITGGTGFAGLRRRLKVFGGGLVFTCQPGGTTSLTATIPLPKLVTSGCGDDRLAGPSVHQGALGHL